MNGTLRTAALIAALLATTGNVAHALVLAEKSPEQKLRADVAKQIAGYARCLLNAGLACEKTGANLGIECDLETATATPPADPRGVFAAQIAKCDAKLDFDRKGPKGNTSRQNHELLGCPRFGDAPIADLQALAVDAGFLKNLVTGIVGNIGSASGCADDKSCKTDAKILFDFFKGVVACQTACENDYKDKKGNGGTTDDLARCGVSGDLAVQVCIGKVFDKYLDKAADWPLRDQAGAFTFIQADDLNDDLFNRPADCN